MAARVEVKSINKTNRQSIHERIHNIGGINADGTRWKLSLNDAIAGIETGKWAFWTMGGGEATDVIIASHNGKST